MKMVVETTETNTTTSYINLKEYKKNQTFWEKLLLIFNFLAFNRYAFYSFLSQPYL